MDQFDFETAQMYDMVAKYDQTSKNNEFVKNVQTSVDANAAEVNITEHEVLALEEESDSSLEMSKEEDSVPIPAEIKNAVFRLHVNTGHRSSQRLARALLVSGAPPAAVIAAKQLRCSVCQERKRPKARPPSSLPPPRNVGQQIHIDLVILEDSMRKPYVVAHVTDNVSRYQQAKVPPDKSTASVIHFLKTHWQPLLGWPHTIVADQGREFVSAEFGDFCDSQSIYLYHIGVGAPWQNGICERSGATLKALVGAITQTMAVSTFKEMEEAVGEAVMAYNSDLNEHGTAPIQLVTGRIPTPGGDVLNNFAKRLAEHSLISSKPSLERQLAIRETARVAMLRLQQEFAKS